ncbi:hypothetical protein ACG74X_19910 [Marivita sp. S0852]|uniref:hypothetical protein n=1 Tax=Marivita sp. S0852 TaxID=3373893 RepID=UPI003981AF75
MFSLEETPFRINEVLQILQISGKEFSIAQRRNQLSRNVLCHFRNDNLFNFPNYFDILSFLLLELDFECTKNEEDTDIVSDFIDCISYALELDNINQYDNLGDTVFRITQAIKSDVYGEELRVFSQFGEYLLNSEVGVIRRSQREDYFCSITVALLHRTMQVFYAPAIKRATAEQVLLVDQTIAVCHGKLCSYVPGESLEGRDQQFVAR